ncbi:GNAT family N-acetyltransferase [Paraliomyxa miuraensis]|uniref:GNAT family N-acetyltransferase n=1 Tax=Paraliomyxa miuraensis TaxID=376150 RepID=UPI0022544F39|nr:GNAT family N-acetyltransferase [Paraliomyxa miuraensis]MCX4242595.1 GNAT family N-acetyltransferase [Paraliomyxa miuraensis]
MPRHRRCLLLRGSRSATREAALAQLDAWGEATVLWIGEPSEQDRFEVVRPRRVSTVLGRSFDAVVLDAHDGIDADVLGQSQGLVWGGGGLLLRMAEPGAGPSRAARERLAAIPYRPGDVGTRFDAHVERALARAERASGLSAGPPAHVVTGHAEQARVIERLLRAWSGPGPTRVAVLADRGRGKSSALGLALGRLLARREPRVAVSAAHAAAVAEVLRFAAGERSPTFVPLPELVFGEAGCWDVIVIDEAAQLPVPMLRRLVERHPEAHLAFATTAHGYEGTGRGFSLRFLAWLERGPVPVQRLGLRQPIRWDEGDPLERMVFDALLLDAEPARVVPEPPAWRRVETEEPLEAVRLDRDALLADEILLRELFGLLVHAHYRTTPGDLHRLLDAPNLELHALRLHGHVVAATVVAHEGALPDALVDDVQHGRTRLRAHALPDALVAHLGKRGAGALRMVRSVRIATHPELRRRGLATRLCEHVHREHAPDLFGTLFGATPELLAFRRRMGYEVVRLSASRGARTGEPAVMMLRAESEVARALVTELRAELARDLPRQLELWRADEELLLDPELVEALVHGLPPPAGLTAAQRDQLSRSYAFGPRTVESVALALMRFVDAQRERLEVLAPSERALVEGRVLEGHGWRRVAKDAGLPGVPAAMRGLRRAVRRLMDDHLGLPSGESGPRVE